MTDPVVFTFTLSSLTKRSVMFPIEGPALILCCVLHAYVQYSADLCTLVCLSLEFKGMTLGCTNMRINISMEINPCLPGHLCLSAHKILSDIPLLCKLLLKKEIYAMIREKAGIKEIFLPVKL